MVVSSIPSYRKQRPDSVIDDMNTLQQTATSLVLGIDGGGTKTVAWLAVCGDDSRERKVVVAGRGFAGPSNQRAVGSVMALKNLDAAVGSAFADAGLPRATSVDVRIGEFLHGHRLTLVQSASFIPDVQPYDVTTTVGFGSTSGAVPAARIRVNLETMHDEDWTDRAEAGWRGQLRRLSRYLQSTRV